MFAQLRFLFSQSLLFASFNSFFEREVGSFRRPYTFLDNLLGVFFFFAFFASLGDLGQEGVPPFPFSGFSHLWRDGNLLFVAFLVRMALIS